MAATGELRLATIGPPDPPVPPDPDTWIAALGSLPLLAQPGERWMYNTGAQVLGVLAARAAGQPFSEVLKTRIFGPLGMPDTGFWTTDSHRLATAYQPTPDGLAVLDEPGGKWSRRRSSVTERPGWCPPPTTCSPSPGCCLAAGRRSCLPTRCGP